MAAFLANHYAGSLAAINEDRRQKAARHILFVIQLVPAVTASIEFYQAMGQTAIAPLQRPSSFALATQLAANAHNPGAAPALAAFAGSRRDT